MNAASFVKELNSNTIIVYEIKESEINKIDEGIPTLNLFHGQ